MKKEINKLALWGKKNLLEIINKMDVVVTTFIYRMGLEKFEEDLKQETALAIAKALDKFDEKKWEFFQYANNWIMQHIFKYVSQIRNIPVPVHIVQYVLEINKIFIELSQENEDVTIDDAIEVVKKKHNLSKQMIDWIKSYIKWELSLDKNYEDSINVIWDFIESKEPTPSDVVEEEYIIQYLEDFEQTLSWQQLEVYNFRIKPKIYNVFNIENNWYLTLDKTSKELNMTWERVRQIENNVIKRLLFYLESKGIELSIPKDKKYKINKII